MDYNNKPKGYYDNIRIEMLKYLPSQAKIILDIGCGNGAFADIIKKDNNAEVWGVEFMEEYALEAKTKLDKVFVGPVEDFLDDLPDHYFDAIYCNDVLEHLVDPYMVLDKLKHKLSENGVVISSIPNIRFFKAFFMLFFNKEWKYQDHGVMDKTHMRFFTKKSIYRMYNDLGYKVLSHQGINKSKSIKPYLFYILTLFTQLDMQYVQFATVAKFNK